MNGAIKWRRSFLAALRARYSLAAVDRWTADPANDRLLNALCGQAGARGITPAEMARRVARVQARGLA